MSYAFAAGLLVGVAANLIADSIGHKMREDGKGNFEINAVAVFLILLFVYFWEHRKK